MVIPNNNVISYCGACEIEYAAPQGNASCPLCPYRVRTRTRSARSGTPSPAGSWNAPLPTTCRPASTAWPHRDGRSPTSALRMSRTTTTARPSTSRSCSEPTTTRSATGRRWTPRRDAFADELAKQLEIEVETEAFMDTLSTGIWG